MSGKQPLRPKKYRPVHKREALRTTSRRRRPQASLSQALRNRHLLLLRPQTRLEIHHHHFLNSLSQAQA